MLFFVYATKLMLVILIPHKMRAVKNMDAKVAVVGRDVLVLSVVPIVFTGVTLLILQKLINQGAAQKMMIVECTLAITVMEVALFKTSFLFNQKRQLNYFFKTCFEINK